MSQATSNLSFQATDPVAGDPRWRAVASRDGSCDGAFVYAVTTTGIYCRPSCPARRAKRQHVHFFATSAAAQAAGFRACRRCRPDAPSRAEQHAATVAAACRAIDAADAPPPLAALAATAGLSASRFHRIFKAVTGLTPRAYAAGQRARRLREELERPDGSTVTAAIYSAGFNASSRFYQVAGDILGMTPAAYRRGGDGRDVRFAVSDCSLGRILVACSERGVCAIALDDDPAALVRNLRRRFPQANLIGDDAGFAEVVAGVVRFIEAPASGLSLPLDLRGTAFQIRVWEELSRIPAGTTASYAEIARLIGAPGAVRAVAGACAANTLAVAIPCHRVIRSDGTLSGYRWGVERKRRLLHREAKGKPTKTP